MGAELFRKYVRSSIIVCYRSVVRHPFLVGMIIFLFSMYRLFPLLFSVLVSASPVVVSTAVLLGTLLSFGQPNLPEIEKEPESERAQIRKVESKVMGRSEIVGSFGFEETNGSRVEVADKSFDDRDVNLVDDGLLELGEVKSEGGEEKVVLGSRYSPLQQSEDEHEHEHIVLENDKLWEGSADPLNSNSGLLWKGVGGSGGGDDDEDEDEDDDDDDGSESGDSGSDLAESSSPDASMADIIPMLDELHPLLSEEQETRERSHVSRDGTDAVSQRSLESSDTSSESDDDTESNDDTGIENHGDLKKGDDDKESEHVDKEAAIKWTEDDQKNLMDLGTLEIERNRRLEDLIARRKAQSDIGIDIENHESLKHGDNEDVDEDKESEQVDKEDDTRSAITWTEDDQKNLMNVGTSEMERDRLLEDLIARKRARDDTGIENHESIKIGDDEDDEEEEEEEDKESDHVDKEDETRSPITWTEDDQKNLMNLGTSELERNRRLENLIARRRARKTMRMQAERNVIDLESSDLPWNIPPISTSRTNPFDYDANDNIPGSAPSVMLQRRNPFDLPYDSSEEKPDLVGDTFEQEFAGFQPREPVFRRHESFNVGPSNFGTSRSERHESKLKPYFVPERSFTTFQRQFSGLSDSKTSSVPDTESVSSDHENKDHIEEDEQSLEAEHTSEVDEHVSDHGTHGRPYFVPEHVASDETGFSSFQRQLSEVSDIKVAESVSSDLENKDDNEEDERSLEAEHASEIDEHVSDHVSHGRPYFVPEHVASGETGFSSFQRQLSEVSDSKVSSDFESDSESVSSAGDLEGKDQDHIDLSVEPDLISFDDHEHGSGITAHVSESFEEAEISVESVTRQQELNSSVSSLSSLDEASEQIYNDKEGDEVAAGSISETEYFMDRGNSIERSELDVTSLVVEDSQPNEPVYDLSPQSSSITVDLHKDESFQNLDDHNQSSSSVVPDSEEHVLDVDNVSRSLPDKPIFEDQDAVLDLSHERFDEEDVMSQLHEESLLGRSGDKPLAEDPEELQAHDLEHGDITLPSSAAQLTEVIHGEDVSQQQKEFPLLDTSVNEPSEDNHEGLQVQTTSHNSDNLQIQEPDVVEVANIETEAREIPSYASDTHSIESNVDDVDEIKEFDEDLLVELDAVGDFSVKDFGSTSNEMKAHDSENKGIAEENSYNNDLGSNSVAEVSYSRSLGSDFDEMKQEYDNETKSSGDEDSDPKDLGTTLDERIQDPLVSDHDLETMVSRDEDSYSKDLGSNSTLDEMQQDPHASNHDLETKHSEEIKLDPHASEHDFEMEHSKEIGQDPLASDHDLETKHSEEMKVDPHGLDHDLETKHSEDDDSYSKFATLDEMKQGPHDSSLDLETKHLKDDSYSKVATLDEMKQDPHDSSQDLETKHLEVEDSYSKVATLDEMKQDPHDSSHDLETKHSGDEDSYSKDLGSTSDEMKRDPHETNQFIEEESYSKDLDTTFNELKGDTHAMEHRLETFYSVDENFYSKHVESAFNEMKHDLHVSDQDFETNRSGDTKIEMDAEVVKSQNENDISKAEASGSKLAGDVNEVVLAQDTESTTSLANPASATAVNHGTDNAPTTSNTDKE